MEWPEHSSRHDAYDDKKITSLQVLLSSSQLISATAAFMSGNVQEQIKRMRSRNTDCDPPASGAHFIPRKAQSL